MKNPSRSRSTCTTRRRSRVPTRCRSGGALACKTPRHPNRLEACPIDSPQFHYRRKSSSSDQSNNAPICPNVKIVVVQSLGVPSGDYPTQREQYHGPQDNGLGYPLSGTRYGDSHASITRARGGVVILYGRGRDSPTLNRQSPSTRIPAAGHPGVKQMEMATSGCSDCIMTVEGAVLSARSASKHLVSEKTKNGF